MYYYTLDFNPDNFHWKIVTLFLYRDQMTAEDYLSVYIQTFLLCTKWAATLPNLEWLECSLVESFCHKSSGSQSVVLETATST